MPLGKVLSVADAVALVRDGDTLATTGYGGNGTPDQLVLELAQCDASGNINVSRFSGRLVGCGGFIDISQRSKKVVFVGPSPRGGSWSQSRRDDWPSSRRAGTRSWSRPSTRSPS